ncbi:hypothetical protein LJB42_000568 [Komagataella kurtzmanii]|nr:hypothetical protein LJB42_000568 [Komagataella kurtzmanii]
MLKLKPKHQRFILQCYPGGKSTEKKPNNAELSHLLYYATTRRTKLEKVGGFLEKKTVKDVGHSRIGNVLVTLDILNQLVIRCSDNLSVFADNVINILTNVSTLHDLTVQEHSFILFKSFCENVTVKSFTGEKKIIDRFNKLCNYYIEQQELATKSHTESSDWLILSLKTCEIIAKCYGNFPSLDKRIIAKSMNLILSKLSLNEHQLLNRTKTNVSHEINTDNVEEVVLKSLKAHFNTTSTTFLTQSTKSVAEFILRSKPSIQGPWSNALLEMLTSWTPVQLRFIVLSSLMSILDHKNEAVLTEKISNLLSSSVSLVGLSVIDVLRQFLTLQANCLKSKLNLTENYVKCISSLALHHYYRSQVPDMVKEISVKLKENYNNIVLFAPVYARNIEMIYQASKENPKDMKFKYGNIDSWSILFSILALKGSSLSEDERLQVQLPFLKLFITFLQSLYSENSEYSMAVPNYNEYLTRTTNPLSLCFYMLDKIVPNEESSKLLSQIIPLLLKIFGVNAVKNGAPFVLERPEGESSLLFLHYAATYLDDPEFEDIVSGHISKALNENQNISALDLSLPNGTKNSNFSPRDIEKQDFVKVIQSNFVSDIPSVDEEMFRVSNGNHVLKNMMMMSRSTRSLSSPYYTRSSPHSSNNSTINIMDVKSFNPRTFSLEIRRPPQISDLKRAVSGQDPTVSSVTSKLVTPSLLENDNDLISLQDLVDQLAVDSADEKYHQINITP